MTWPAERIVLVHREEPILNVYDSPENDVFEPENYEGRFFLKLPLSHSMVGPWLLIARERVTDGYGTPYTRAIITRPASVAN